MRNDVALVDVCYSQATRHGNQSLGELALDACRKVIASSGLRVEDIDGICNYPSPSRIGAGSQDGVDFVGVDFISRGLQLTNLRWEASITDGTIAACVVQAMNAIAAGTCETVLVWRGMHHPQGKFGAFTSTHVPGAAQFEAPYGLASYVMNFAFAYSEYMAKYGAKREHLGTYVVNSRLNGSINPDSIFFGKPLTMEQYMAARMIAEPLSLLDCDMPVDCCGAIIVTTAERAKDLCAKPVHIVGGATGGSRLHHSPIITLDAHRQSGQVVANALWKNTGLSAKDMDFANLYDGFAYFIYMWLELLGFCKYGEAFEYIQDGRIALEGAMPLNPSGGAAGMGRLHGTPHLFEAVLQLQGRAGERQLRKANTTVVTTGSPCTHNGVLVLSNAWP
ncbi:thiolase C-terminal domain-containing protein [Ramlibacter sp.]|uniref:thiolase C-terminal domain-containing protein n=1 Tax=Ramlibacter sp. TaxID=1917967 RepID=UPI003D0E5BD9